MRVFIANIPFTADHIEFRMFLENRIGAVNVFAWIYNKRTSEFRGFAFVEFYAEDDNYRAIQELNDVEYQGRRLVVKEANPKEN